ncbi:hypothetical protein [Pseudomonas phage PPAY]|nr:hypothetical protein [Pseudomonas phage PPAY]
MHRTKTYHSAKRDESVILNCIGSAINFCAIDALTISTSNTIDKTIAHCTITTLHNHTIAEDTVVISDFIRVTMHITSANVGS